MFKIIKIIIIIKGASQAATLLKQQQRQINGQLRSLPTIFNKQMELHSSSSSVSSARDYTNGNRTNNASMQKPNQIFNPYKAMSLYKTDDKLNNLNMPSLQAPPIDRILENI